MSQRLVGGFIPPPVPLIGDPSGSARDPRDRDLDLWNRLQLEPIIPIQILTVTASKLILSRPCILAGWTLRETSGTASAQVEFIDGADATGVIVGEQTLPAPLPGSVGNTDTAVTATATGTTGSITANLPGVAGQTTFITGFEITGSGATVAITGIATLAGVITGTLSFDWGVPLGAAVPATPLVIAFATPIPASAVNTPITLTVPASGAGATAIACALHGFQRSAGATAAQTGVSAVQGLPGFGVLCRSGLWMRVIAGSVVGAAYVRM